MNLCFLMGKICSSVRFEFILNSKNISIAIFNIELKNKSIVTLKAYNEMADFCYSKLEKDDIIGIKGYLNGKNEIVIEEMEAIWKKKH